MLKFISEFFMGDILIASSRSVFAFFSKFWITLATLIIVCMSATNVP